MATRSPIPASWGGASDSLDYEAYLDADVITDPPISLEGASVTGITFETLDPVYNNTTKKVRGRRKRVRETLRAAEAIGGTLTVNTGNTIWSPVLTVARTPGACPRTLWIVRLCPTDPEAEVAYGYTKMRFGPATRPNDAVTINDVVGAEWQSEATFEEEIIIYAVGLFENDDLTEPIYAVAVMTEECVGCTASDQPYLEVVATGGVGGAEDSTVIYTSDDRFATQTAVTNTIPDAHVGTCVFTEGNVILTGFAAFPDVANAGSTTGGTTMSTDRGATAATIDTNITEPVRGVTRLGNRYIAVGGTAAGDGLIWESTNGITWTAVPTGSLATGNAFTAVATDHENLRFYAVGQAGVMVMGRLQGTSIALSAITLPGSPGQLDCVTVLAPKHIAVGGASNYYAESLDGATTWEQNDVPGSGSVKAIAGTPYSTFIGVANVVYRRSILDGMEFEAVSEQLGLTLSGDITSLAVPENEHNYCAFSTDDGELGMITPFLPQA